MRYLGLFWTFVFFERKERFFGFGEPLERGIFLLVTLQEHPFAASATNQNDLCNNAVLLTQMPNSKHLPLASPLTIGPPSCIL